MCTHTRMHTYIYIYTCTSAHAHTNKHTYNTIHTTHTYKIQHTLYTHTYTCHMHIPYIHTLHTDTHSFVVSFKS